MNIQLKKQKWIEFSENLIMKMNLFDNKYMDKKKYHCCISKEIFDEGKWYCNHLINARLRNFKNEFKKEQELFLNIL